MLLDPSRLGALLAVSLLLGCPANDDDNAADDDAADDDAADDDSDVDGPCSDGWGFIDDPFDAVHVRQDGDDAAGDGTIGAPLATVPAALLTTRESGQAKTIAIGPGVFGANLWLHDDTVDAHGNDATDNGLAIEGCGVDETTLVPIDAGESVFNVNGAADVRLAGFAVDGGNQSLWLKSGTVAAIESVTIRNAIDNGLLVSGSATVVMADRVVVEDTLRDMHVGEPEGGEGILVNQATMTISMSEVHRSVSSGILVEFGEVYLDGVTVEDTLPDEDGRYGRGIMVVDQSIVELRDCSLSGNHDAGIWSDSSLWLLVEDCQIAGTVAGGHGEPTGDGIVITQGGLGYDPGSFTNTVTGTNCTNSARAGIIVDGVAVELSGNVAGGDNGLSDDGVSIYVQNLDDAGAFVSGTDEYVVPDEPLYLDH
jgi:hypothetical protein